MDHKNSLLDMATTSLANKPWVGICSTAGGGVLSVMDVLTPYLQFSVLVLSFTIGVITLIGVTKKHLLNK